MTQENAKTETNDVSVIRPKMTKGEIGFRGQEFEAGRLAEIRKGLRALHTLELMAATI